MNRFAFAFAIAVFGCLLLGGLAHAVEKLPVVQIAPSVYVAYGYLAQIDTENRGFNEENHRRNAHHVYLEEQKKLLFGK